jgi:uncharacterized protein (DUF1330 family)
VLRKSPPFIASFSLALFLLASALWFGSPLSSNAADQKAYVVNEITVTDASKYQTYADQVPATLVPFGGAFMVRGGNPAVLDGAPVTGRIVVVVFPSREQALAWHESAAYQKILSLRNASSTSRVYIVDGVAP